MKILAVNPGSTSTKVAVYVDDQEVFKKTVVHDAAKLATFPQVMDQMPYRVETILEVCQEHGVDISDCDAFVGRGGGLRSCEGGTYTVNDIMIEHVQEGGGMHPATLGPQIAKSFGDKYGKPSFTLNPPDVDELCDEARVTGLKGVYRVSSFHALNQKETAIRVAKDLGKTYEECNFVVAHIGGGVSVTAHRKGKAIDTNGIIYGEGPFTPTRIGAMPAKAMIDLCFSGKSESEIRKILSKSGGFVDHLGTSETLEVVDMIKNGNQYAKIVYDAFQYQIAKAIGSMAAALCGKVDAIILTGGIAHDKELCARLQEMVGFIAPFEIRAGEFEMEALAAGAIRVLKGEEEVKEYTGEVAFKGFEHLMP